MGRLERLEGEGEANIARTELIEPAGNALAEGEAGLARGRLEDGRREGKLGERRECGWTGRGDSPGCDGNSVGGKLRAMPEQTAKGLART